MTIACVLKSGGEYKPEHVRALAKAVTHYDKLVCLTDLPDAVSSFCQAVPLEHEWPGWWSKIELFRPGLFHERVLYLDLDTVICGPIAPLFMTFGTMMLRDFRLESPSSAVMAWEPDDLAHVYESFRKCLDPLDEKHKVNPQQKVYGDQSWIERCLSDDEFSYFQDICPERIHLWHDCRNNRPAGASLICYAGGKRPWNTGGWARAYYRG